MQASDLAAACVLSRASISLLRCTTQDSSRWRATALAMGRRFCRSGFGHSRIHFEAGMSVEITMNETNGRHAEAPVRISGQPPAADALSDVLSQVRLTGAMFLNMELSAPWLTESPPFACACPGIDALGRIPDRVSPDRRWQLLDQASRRGSRQTGGWRCRDVSARRSAPDGQ